MRAVSYFALATKWETRELPERKEQHEEELCSFCPPLPHAREFEGCPARKRTHRLQTSPVSWLGGVHGSQPSRKGAVACEAFSKRPLPGRLQEPDILPLRPLPGRTDVSGFRLTVARRRRIVVVLDWIGQRTVFPSTKSAVNVVCGTAPQGWGERERLPVLRVRQNCDARPTVAAHLHFQWDLKNLFEQFALVNSGGRPDTQTAAALH